MHKIALYFQDQTTPITKLSNSGHLYPNPKNVIKSPGLTRSGTLLSSLMSHCSLVCKRFSKHIEMAIMKMAKKYTWNAWKGQPNCILHITFWGREEYIHVQKILMNKKSEDITQCNNAFNTATPSFDANDSPNTYTRTWNLNNARHCIHIKVNSSCTNCEILCPNASCTNYRGFMQLVSIDWAINNKQD